MPRYRFQFETGHLYDGPTEIVVKDFTAEIKKVSPSLAAVIEARGGQLVSELLRVGSYPAVTPKKREKKPVKRTKKEEVSK